MEEENLTFKQELKKSFFTFEQKNILKDKKEYSTIKTTNNVLTNLANKREFSEVRKRYKVHSFLEKILIKKILNYILFAFYRNQKLSIAVLHPVAQSELNFQKQMIINYAKQVKEFQDIKEVAVFRYDKLYSFSKNFDKKSFEHFTSPFKHNENNNLNPLYKERSYGIFENKIKDKKLHEKMEEIRNIIKNS